MLVELMISTISVQLATSIITSLIHVKKLSSICETNASIVPIGVGTRHFSLTSTYILQCDYIVDQNKSVHVSLTSCIHSNVYGLGNIHCIRYLTAVDPFHSTSSAVQMHHHLTSASIEIPLIT